MTGRLKADGFGGDPVSYGETKILIVDDEQGPRDSLRMILSPEHHVLQASSGIEAIECLRREPVDLMTLDLHMPGMNGQQLLRNCQTTIDLKHRTLRLDQLVEP